MYFRRGRQQNFGKRESWKKMARFLLVITEILLRINFSFRCGNLFGKSSLVAREATNFNVTTQCAAVYGQPALSRSSEAEESFASNHVGAGTERQRQFWRGRTTKHDSGDWGNGSVLGDVNEERTLSIDDSLRILSLIASLTLLAMCVCVCLCSRVRVRVFT